LDVHSQGETPEKAKSNLAEAISLFIVTSFEAGTLDDVLTKCGFVKGRVPMPKRMKSYDPVPIEVPIPFPIPRGTISECRV
jgi:hypothetical protein